MATGFEGFVTFGDLPTVGVPERPGVYVVLRPDGVQPTFLPSSQAGRHKGKNPSLSVDDLRSRWVNEADVLYVGKAGGEPSKATLRKRLTQYVRFGRGHPAGHCGGRAIFQISDWENLMVAWRVDDQPSRLESSLLKEFKTTFGALPFANARL